MVPLKTHDLEQVYVTLGGQRLGGWGEGGGIAFEFVSDIVEDSVSADGQVTVSRLNDFRILATVTCRANTNTARVLGEMWRTQQAQPTITPLPFLMLDANSGDEISDQYAVFKTVPAPSKERALGDLEWVILLPNAGRDMLHARSVAF